MFAYLSKKIAIPNNIRLNCIAWNKTQGYIAIGGENGLLKVIRADSANIVGNSVDSNNLTRSTNVISNLSMNQTLEGHSGQVQVVTWNEEHQKLTSSDENGVIIVWMLYKGSWYEEMINNRNKSVVKDMAWSSDGQKICIVYEDGAVIVGSVEGNRIWGKELKNISLTAVKWSPDTKFLLFGSKTGDIHLYDNQGIFLMKLNSITTDHIQSVVAICWYNGRNGYTANNCPVLLICFQNGKILLLRNTNDDDPIELNTKVLITCCAWNTFGSLFAIAGKLTSDGIKDFNVINFYSVFGKHIKTLKVPGKDISGCAWEEGSLRLSLSVDSNIYFVNIHPNHKWAYFSNTVVFSDEKISKDGICVTFWNTVTNARYFKYVKSLINIAAYGEHCVITAKIDPIQSGEEFSLTIYNAISTPIDTKFLNFEPIQITINDIMVIIASENNFMLWYFHPPYHRTSNSKKYHRNRVYHIDDTPTGVTEVIQDLDKYNSFHISSNQKDSTDSICSISASEKVLLMGRESGLIQQYSLPQITLIKRYITVKNPWKIAINCDSSRIAIINDQGLLNLLDLHISKEQNRLRGTKEKNDQEDVLKFERKDVWAICWAEDNPDMLAISEKSRIYVFRGLEPEEPITCSAYVCCFNDLEIRCIFLDALLRHPEMTNAELLLELEIKSLRDTKKLLKSVSFHETEEFVRNNSHPRLWKLLGEYALQKLNYDTAENAMVRCHDYIGIRFVKKLRNVLEPALRRAEVLAFLEAYDEAEQTYLNLDRRDLAVTLRQKLTHYQRSLQLMQSSTGGSDFQLTQTHSLLGEQLVTYQNWQDARNHLEQAHKLNLLLDCYYHLEEFDELAVVAKQLNDEVYELRRAARMLASVGMCQEAVACYIRSGDVKQAVETCIRSNRWDQALELARTCKLPGIDDLLSKYAHHLLKSGRKLQAVELYRKANCPLEAAKLLLSLASEQANRRTAPLRLKKIYILSALLVEDYLTRSCGTGMQTRSDLLMGLDKAGSEDASTVEEAWRGAEAYHFLMLAHRQLYAVKAEAAIRTAMRLREYEDLVDRETIYTLLALASVAYQAFATCSRAFVHLEDINSDYEELALLIFESRPPKDEREPSKSKCLQCKNLISDYCVSCPNCFSKFPACIVSGQSLIDQNSIWLCTVCKHRVISERDVITINGCPLCHSIITYT